MFRLPTIAGCYSEQITNQNKKSVYKRPEKRCKIYTFILMFEQDFKGNMKHSLSNKMS